MLQQCIYGSAVLTTCNLYLNVTFMGTIHCSNFVTRMITYCVCIEMQQWWYKATFVRPRTRPRSQFSRPRPRLEITRPRSPRSQLPRPRPRSPRSQFSRPRPIPQLTRPRPGLQDVSLNISEWVFSDNLLHWYWQPNSRHQRGKHKWSSSSSSEFIWTGLN